MMLMQLMRWCNRMFWLNIFASVSFKRFSTWSWRSLIPPSGAAHTLKRVGISNMPGFSIVIQEYGKMLATTYSWLWKKLLCLTDYLNQCSTQSIFNCGTINPPCTGDHPHAWASGLHQMYLEDIDSFNVCTQIVGIKLCHGYQFKQMAHDHRDLHYKPFLVTCHKYFLQQCLHTWSEYFRRYNRKNCTTSVCTLLYQSVFSLMESSPDFCKAWMKHLNLMPTYCRVVDKQCAVKTLQSITVPSRMPDTHPNL